MVSVVGQLDLWELYSWAFQLFGGMQASLLHWLHSKQGSLCGQTQIEGNISVWGFEVCLHSNNTSVHLGVFVIAEVYMIVMR